jgi:hypothetical protein
MERKSLAPSGVEGGDAWDSLARWEAQVRCPSFLRLDGRTAGDLDALSVDPAIVL